MRKQALFAAGFATLAAVLWAASLGAASQLPAGMPVVEIVAMRYSIQLVLLAVVVLPFRGRHLVQTRKPRLQIARGLTMVAMPITFEIAVHRLGASEALGVLWLAPLFGIVFDQTFGREGSSRTTTILAVAATTGAILAHSPVMSLSTRGTVLILCAAAAFGAFFSLTRELRSEPASSGLFWTAGCVAACLLPVLPFVWQRPSAHAIAALAALSVLWLLVLFNIDEALRRAPLRLLAPFLLTEVIWTRLLFHAPWSTGAVAGAAIVVASAAAVLTILLNPNADTSAVASSQIV